MLAVILFAGTNLFCGSLGKSQKLEPEKSSCHTVLKNKQYYVKVLPNRFCLNGNIGFHPQTQKIEIAYKTAIFNIRQ